LACKALFLNFRGQTPQKIGLNLPFFELRHSLYEGRGRVRLRGRFEHLILEIYLEFVIVFLRALRGLIFTILNREKGGDIFLY